LFANIAVAGEFTLKSDQIGGQLTIDQEASVFGCSGKNISPQLKWMNAEEHKELRAYRV
jgi:phosphatidylethanolamine-binding protein (PEBP) family uncharacterized protein